MKLQHEFGMAQTVAWRSSQLKCCLHHGKAPLSCAEEAGLEPGRGVGRLPSSSHSDRAPSPCFGWVLGAAWSPFPGYCVWCVWFVAVAI